MVQWKGTRRREEGVCFAVRDGLLECPNHFSTLRVPQKNLFSSTLAQPGRTGLVLTDLPPFIVTSLPTNSLLLPRLQLLCRCSSLRGTLTRNICVHTCLQAHTCSVIWNANAHIQSWTVTYALLSTLHIWKPPAQGILRSM